MFTGLVQAVGRIAEVRAGAGSKRIGIVSPWTAGELQEGESIAVDGVCLTLTGRRGDRFYADAVAETLGRSTLGSARAGRRVNLERSLRPTDRLGGHWVQGHVDATAAVREIRRRGDDWRLRVELPASIRRFVAEKGSIALQGVSLTVAALGEDVLEVAVVPETLARTTLADLAVGARVNVEVDLLARYLERLMDPRFVQDRDPSSQGRAARQSRPK